MSLMDNEKTTVSMHKHLETMHESLNVLDCSNWKGEIIRINENKISGIKVKSKEKVARKISLKSHLLSQAQSIITQQRKKGIGTSSILAGGKRPTSPFFCSEHFDVLFFVWKSVSFKCI